MKFYLSSYKIGNEGEKLREMSPTKKIFYISNAVDHKEVNLDRRAENMNLLKQLGFEVEFLDLKNYFGKSKKLFEKLDKVKSVFISGGNTFVLRQAMRLSGFDKYILNNLDRDFLYAGFSAAICILYKDMKALQIVDEPYIYPYKEIKETIWEGLGILDYMLLPHYKSDHPESADIDKEVEFCKKNNIPFKTLRDGEVIIIE